MKLVFKKVRETKNWSVYQLEGIGSGMMPKSQLYFDKGMPDTITFEQVANEEPKS